MSLRPVHGFDHLDSHTMTCIQRHLPSISKRPACDHVFLLSQNILAAVCGSPKEISRSLCPKFTALQAGIEEMAARQAAYLSRRY